MGSLRDFDIKDLKTRYKLQSFVETGTWRGDAVEYAYFSDFNPIFSVELKTEFWEYAVRRFEKRDPIKILQGTSLARLLDILPNLKGATLWWLDAHLQDTYGLSKDITDRFPLEKELKLMSSLRDLSRDVIIMDDLRVYETGPFKNGNAPKNHSCPTQGTKFIEDILGSTHTCEKLYDNEGYVFCKPVH